MNYFCIKQNFATSSNIKILCITYIFVLSSKEIESFTAINQFFYREPPILNQGKWIKSKEKYSNSSTPQQKPTDSLSLYCQTLCLYTVSLNDF